jgi:hypothetical protein
MVESVTGSSPFGSVSQPIATAKYLDVEIVLKVN